MNNDNQKRRIMVKFKHVTAVAVISTALISSFNSMVYAVSTPAIHNLYKGYIYLMHKDSAKNLLAANSEKRKGYKVEDRIYILSSLIDKDVEFIKGLIQNGKTTREIAKEYNVLSEFDKLVLAAYNSGLDKLYSDGKLSDEEYNSLYNNADLSFINTCDIKSETSNNLDNFANINTILSNLTGLNKVEIERILSLGQTPWEIAKEYNKHKELKDLVLEDMLSNIDKMIEEGKMTNSEADALIADFETAFLETVKF